MTTSTSTDLEIAVLGSFSTARIGQPVDLGGKLQRSVLALLVAAGGQRVSHDRLLVGVWGDRSPGRGLGDQTRTRFEPLQRS